MKNVNVVPVGPVDPGDVRTYQEHNSLYQDGIVGRQTFTHMRDTIAHSAATVLALDDALNECLDLIDVYEEDDYSASPIMWTPLVLWGIVGAGAVAMIVSFVKEAW